MTKSSILWDITPYVSEVSCSSRTLANFQQTLQHYIPEDITLDNHCCENMKCYLVHSHFQEIVSAGSKDGKTYRHDGATNLSFLIE
jgi:hypothetical protein